MHFFSCLVIMMVMVMLYFMLFLTLKGLVFYGVIFSAEILNYSLFFSRYVNNFSCDKIKIEEKCTYISEITNKYNKWMEKKHTMAGNMDFNM